MGRNGKSYFLVGCGIASVASCMVDLTTFKVFGASGAGDVLVIHGRGWVHLRCVRKLSSSPSMATPKSQQPR